MLKVWGSDILCVRGQTFVLTHANHPNPPWFYGYHFNFWNTWMSALSCHQDPKPSSPWSVSAFKRMPSFLSRNNKWHRMSQGRLHSRPTPRERTLCMRFTRSSLESQHLWGSEGSIGQRKEWNCDAGERQTSDNRIWSPGAIQSCPTLRQEAWDFIASSTTPLITHWILAVPGEEVWPYTK